MSWCLLDLGTVHLLDRIANRTIPSVDRTQDPGERSVSAFWVVLAPLPSRRITAISCSTCSGVDLSSG